MISKILLRHFRKLGARFWVPFLVAATIVEGGELIAEHLLESHAEGAQIANSFFVFSDIYQGIVSAPRPAVTRAVTVVEINPRRDVVAVSSVNVCDERDFLATLLEQIQLQRPAVIVIDKHFGEGSCPTEDVRTERLRAVVAKIRDEGGSVVVGVTAAVSESSRKPFIEPFLQFSDSDTDSQQGVLNIADDNRHLPLQWRMQDGEGDGREVVRDTLALTAAKLARPDLVERNRRLKRFLDNGQQPFIAFIPHGDLERASYEAGGLLCGRNIPAGGDWSACETPDTEALAKLRNQIVLIGENSPDGDRQHSVVGELAGVYLQANYIEALLDDRLYVPSGHGWDLATAFVFMLLLQVILIRCAHHARDAMLLIGGLVIALGALLYFLVLQFGIYVDAIPISVIAVLVKVGHLVYEYALHRHPHPARTA